MTRENRTYHYHTELRPQAGELLRQVRLREGRLLHKLMEMMIIAYAEKHHPDLHKAYLEACDDAQNQVV